MNAKQFSSFVGATSCLIALPGQHILLQNCYFDRLATARRYFFKDARGSARNITLPASHYFILYVSAGMGIASYVLAEIALQLTLRILAVLDRRPGRLYTFIADKPEHSK